MDISTSNSRSTGLSGLVSGLDTQSMVDKLLSGTQNKIDKQNALKQQTIWKQEAYRKMISSFNTLQNKYFSYANPQTNLLSQSIFNSMSSIVSSDSIKVNPYSSASVGTIKINQITQLAESKKETSASKATSPFEGDVDLNSLRKEITINIDGTSRTISFTGKTKSEISTSLNTSLQAAFGADVSSSIENGKVVISHTDSAKNIVITDGTDIAFAFLGISKGKSENGKVEMDVNEINNVLKLNINLDGISKSIEINSDASNLTSFISSINTSLQNAFGNGIKASEFGGKIVFSTHKSDGSIDDSRNFTIKGDEFAIKSIGITNGQSNKVNLNLPMNQSNFKTKIQGVGYEFKINGVTIKGSTSESISNMINKINNSNAGVRVSYSSIEDKFSIESATLGANVSIDIKQIEGNVLTALFGASSGMATQSNILFDKSKIFSHKDASAELDSGKLEFFVDGSKVSIQIPDKLDSSGQKVKYTLSEFVSEVNSKLTADHPTLNVSFSIDNTKVVLNNGGHEVVLVNDSKMSELGFDATEDLNYRKATASSLLSDVGIREGNISIMGREFDLNLYKDKSLGEFVRDINAHMSSVDSTAAAIFDSNTSQIIISGGSSNNSIISTDAAGRDSMVALFGSEAIDFNSPVVPGATANGTVVVRNGQNAKLEVNGVLIERNTNNFEIDGLSIELLKTSTTEIDIKTDRDTTKVLDAIKSFIKDYNELLDTVNGLLNQEAKYKEYPPLTAEQKKEMTESEIKLWEEKAKEGLLKNDRTLSSILQNMREVLYQKPQGAKYALYDLGITSGSWQDGGKLNFPEPPTKLLNILENEPHEIQKLFTDATDGLSVKMNEIITSSIKSSHSGSIAELAGLPGSNNVSSIMGRKINSIDKALENLKRTYEKEKSRYWSQFNTMENVIAKMNQQSVWLAQQMGG